MRYTLDRSDAKDVQAARTGGLLAIVGASGASSVELSIFMRTSLKETPGHPKFPCPPRGRDRRALDHQVG